MLPMVRLSEPAEASSFLRLIVIFISKASPSSTLRIYKKGKFDLRFYCVFAQTVSFVQVRTIYGEEMFFCEIKHLWEKRELGNVFHQDVVDKSSDNHLGARVEDGVHLKVFKAEVEELLFGIAEKGIEGRHPQGEVDENVAGLLQRRRERFPSSQFRKQRL